MVDMELATLALELVDKIALVKTEIDGHHYEVRPMMWSLAKVDAYWNNLDKFDIFSDDIPHTRDGFERFVLSSSAIWFEFFDDDQVCGLMYVADLVPSLIEKRFISATWHATVWDAKVGPRMPIAREAIRAVFKILRLHRLEVIIPLKAGGAIRVAKKIGFLQEGRLRAFYQYHGEWWDCLILSILETDDDFWRKA
jgi:RimJ/RimL family protein N-acetyltransferase